MGYFKGSGGVTCFCHNLPAKMHKFNDEKGQFKCFLIISA